MSSVYDLIVIGPVRPGSARQLCSKLGKKVALVEMRE